MRAIGTTVQGGLKELKRKNIQRVLYSHGAGIQGEGKSLQRGLEEED